MKTNLLIHVYNCQLVFQLPTLNGVAKKCSHFRYIHRISIVNKLTLLKKIDIDIDMVVFENIDINIDIYKAIQDQGG